MELSTQMRAEVETIHNRLTEIHQNFMLPIKKETIQIGGISFRTKAIVGPIIEELIPYKVALENLLCKTDNKEQAYLHQCHFVSYPWSKT